LKTNLEELVIKLLPSPKAILVDVNDGVNEAGLVHVIGLDEPPPDVNTYPDVPAVVGRLKLYVPAAA
jgi:hypothetical protein